ncbi:MAG: hypothetical protein QOE82_1179 [Thermoanaerobaculia bacterium]|nr:hypothetical protein [Thermoanaerobaculia bacterium]
MRRLIPLAVLLFAIVFPQVARAQVCSAEYSGDQCDQMNRDAGDPNGNSGGGGGCPYYMCGNATEGVISSSAWCEASQRYTDCPIFYCTYSACVGTNCTPESITCSSCASRQGNNVHISDCPRR